MTTTEFWLQFHQVGAAWAAAFGTVSATITALWLAQKATRDKRNEHDLSAQALQCIIAPELLTVKYATKAIPGIVDGIRGDNGQGSDSTRDTLGFIASRLAMPATFQYFPYLTRLGNADCITVSLIVGELPRLSRAIVDLSARYDSFGDRRDEVLESLGTRANDLLLLISRLHWAEDGED
jgi:hypothetical protein